MKSRKFRLETTRLCLGDLIASDLESIHMLRSHPEVIRYFPGIRSDHLTDTQSWLEETIKHNSRVPRRSYNLAILKKPELIVIGWIGIGNMKEGLPGDLDFGYALLPDYWGMGYASEALNAVINFAFIDLDASRLFGECDLKNAASARVMENAGLKQISPNENDHHSDRVFMISRGMWKFHYSQEES
jgi:RimJ/RimL family protein N-acetyltransferase